MNEPLVKVEVRGRVGLLTLNRPKALNALSNAVIDELAEAVRKFDADDNNPTRPRTSTFTNGSFMPSPGCKVNYRDEKRIDTLPRHAF